MPLLQAGVDSVSASGLYVVTHPLCLPKEALSRVNLDDFEIMAMFEQRPPTAQHLHALTSSQAPQPAWLAADIANFVAAAMLFLFSQISS
jgi:hypothetical protein